MHEKIAAISRHHTPNARNNSLVYSVWEDGEVTLEKGGEWFGSGSYHIMDYGFMSRCWDKSLFPEQSDTNGRILTDNYLSAITFRELILQS